MGLLGFWGFRGLVGVWERGFRESKTLGLQKPVQRTTSTGRFIGSYKWGYK